MKEMTITQAQLTIHTLRVGTKQVTKAMWNQIPKIYNLRGVKFNAHGIVSIDGGEFLIDVNGEPRRVTYKYVGEYKTALREIESCGFINCTSNDRDFYFSKQILSASEWDKGWLLTHASGNISWKKEGDSYVLIARNPLGDIAIKSMADEQGLDIKELKEYRHYETDAKTIEKIKEDKSNSLVLFASIYEELKKTVDMFEGLPQLYIAV